MFTVTTSPARQLPPHRPGPSLLAMRSGLRTYAHAPPPHNTTSTSATNQPQPADPLGSSPFLTVAPHATARGTFTSNSWESSNETNTMLHCSSWWSLCGQITMVFPRWCLRQNDAQSMCTMGLQRRTRMEFRPSELCATTSSELERTRGNPTLSSCRSHYYVTEKGKSAEIQTTISSLTTSIISLCHVTINFDVV